MPASCGNRPGLTLIELLLAMFIAGVCVAVAVPAYVSGLPRDPAQRVAEQVGAILRRAGRAAVSTRMRVDLVIDRDSLRLPQGVEVEPARAMFTILPSGATWGDSMVVRDDSTVRVLRCSLLGEPSVR